MNGLRTRFSALSLAALLGAALVDCSSSSPGSSSGDDGANCYPDNDGIDDQPATILLSVSDTEFSKTVITTQNASTVTFTLTNTGTKPHGFSVGCTSVLGAYPDLPKGCASAACFPSDSTISALAPGQSQTITFLTPVPDNLVYPFQSNEPDDADVPGLTQNLGWNLM
jgi:hypothetical protein